MTTTRHNNNKVRLVGDQRWFPEPIKHDHNEQRHYLKRTGQAERGQVLLGIVSCFLASTTSLKAVVELPQNNTPGLRIRSFCSQTAQPLLAPVQVRLNEYTALLPEEQVC